MQPEIEDIEVTLDDLSPMLRDLAEALGIEDALTVVRKLGGLWVSIPQHLNPDHTLIETLGEDLAKRLVHWYGGRYVQLPLGQSVERALKQKKAKSLWRQGLTYNEMARQTGVCTRTIYAWVNHWLKTDPTPKQAKTQQLSLFEASD